MSYSFNYDLGKLPREFFRDVAKLVDKKDLHKKFGGLSKLIVKKFKVDETLGINSKDAISIVEDLTKVYVKNMIYAEDFKKAKSKILLLPHCCRKYIDFRCKAKFDPKYSSYSCTHCSEDCLANKATKLGESKGYRVFILAGGSCIIKILDKVKCDAVLGIGCTEELILGAKFIKSKNKIGKGLPLTKNGCLNTKFNIESLKKELV
ncbi:MAG: hypothetical protein DRP06_00150 [Candidatus Aenigmatarchaeota archaeon]|nr:MAG: hypothetical protein DRP06_00150 [Candidatus Aenigmarchaeota archaeon]